MRGHAVVLLLALGLAASAAAPQRLQGKLGILVRQGQAPTYELWQSASTKYIIKNVPSNRQLPPFFYTGTAQDHYVPADPHRRIGSPVAVTGELVDNATIAITSLASIQSLQPSTSQGFSTAPLTEPFQVLVINTRFSNGQAAVTNQEIEQGIIPRANSHFRNCSYGRMSIHPNARVVGPVDIGPAVTSCPSDMQFELWMATAKAQVRTLVPGLEPDDWPFVAYAWPDDFNCNWAAVAYMSCTGQRTWPPCWSQFNGRYMLDYIAVHEWGHNLGVGHSTTTINGILYEVCASLH